MTLILPIPRSPFEDAVIGTGPLAPPYLVIPKTSVPIPVGRKPRGASSDRRHPGTVMLFAVAERFSAVAYD
jgi:hypothetical protein